MGRMLILGGLVAGLVGMAGNGQTPSKAVASSEEMPAPEAKGTKTPCTTKLGPAGATATIVPNQEPDGDRCGFRIHPKAVCIRSAGAIFWVVDMRTYPTSGCPTVSGFKLKNFLSLHDGASADPFEDNGCKQLRKADGPAGALDKGFVTRCVLKRHDNDEDYEYEAVPIDENGKELTPVDPEIRVRG